jgi:hypothetical protein
VRVAKATVLPTEQQASLLRAALDGGPPGRQALAQWAQQVRFDDLDGASERLIPLVYATHGSALDHPDAARMRGLYRRSWLRNQHLSRAAAPAIEALTATGIDVIALKGLSLAQRAYGDRGARPMSDVDVLVRPTDRAQALQVLHREGWAPSAQYRQPQLVRPAVGHGVNLYGPDGGSLDLHWRLIGTRVVPTDDDEGLWVRQTPAPDIGPAVARLSPADELLHLMVHGQQWNPLSPIRWIADSVLLIRETEEDLDWSVLSAEARRRQVTVLLRRGLAVAASFGAPVPQRALDALATIRVRPAERYQAAVSQTRLVLLPTPVHYRRVARIEGHRPTPSGLAEFVRHYYELAGPGDLAVRLRRRLPFGGAFRVRS